MEISLHFICISTVVFISKTVKAAPPSFCFAPFNKSDCNVDPIQVFTYYRPGSRCEIELWKGCPTLNKFENEYECSHYCIGKLSPTFSAEMNNVISRETISEKTNPTCYKRVNLNDCGSEAKEIYTFDSKKGTCNIVVWRGCESENKFENEGVCLKNCKPELANRQFNKPVNALEVNDALPPEKSSSSSASSEEIKVEVDQGAKKEDENNENEGKDERHGQGEGEGDEIHVEQVEEGDDEA